MNRRTAQAMLTMQETNRIMQSTAEGRRTTEWHQRLTGMTLQGRQVAAASSGTGGSIPGP